MAAHPPVIEYIVMMAPEEGKVMRFLGMSELSGVEAERRRKEIEGAVRSFVRTWVPAGIPFVLAIDFEKADQVSVFHRQGQDKDAAIAAGHALAEMSPEDFRPKVAATFEGRPPFRRLK